MTSYSVSPFFIAEVSANHLGSLERAHQLIDAAAYAGADAVKFQTYTPDTMTLNHPNFAVSSDHPLWGGKTLYQLYQEALTPWEWHPELFSHAREVGLTPFSSPFDVSAVDFLEELDVEMYKVASLETSDLDLIRKIGTTMKPTIISTGATNLDEIEYAVNAFQSTGNLNLTLLVCTSSYPAEPKEAHIRRVATLKSKFDVPVGISDHTLGIGVSVAAIALGASVIEKHITLKRSDGGADSAFSMEPEEFKQLIQEGRNAHISLGDSSWQILASENESRRLRRSLYIVRDVKQGETISSENVRAIRPAGGLTPCDMSLYVGKIFNGDYSCATPLSREMFE